MLGRVNDLDIRLLRVFVKIVECGGFKPAQIALNISASQISGHMNDLETRLGFRLCERGRSGFRVTPQGEVIHQEAIKLLEHLERFRSVAADQTGKLSGDFRIAMMDNLITSPDYPIPQALQRFSSHEHDVRLTLEILPAVEIENRILDGSLELGGGFFYHQLPGLLYEPIFREQHFLYCGPSHPLFKKEDDEITLADIEVAGILNRGFYEESQELSIDGGPVQPKFATENAAFAVNPEAMTTIVMSGFCLAYIPSHYAQRFEDRDQIRPIWPDRIYQFGNCHLVRKAGSAPSLVVQTFLDALRDVQSAKTI